VDSPTPAALKERFVELSTAELTAISTAKDFSATARSVALEVLATRRATQPRQPCAVHPTSETVGACARCGAFICIECDASFARYRRGLCGACQTRRARARGWPLGAVVSLVSAGCVLFNTLAWVAHQQWAIAAVMAGFGGLLLVVGLAGLAAYRRGQ
jgi:hypothetical protein